MKPIAEQLTALMDLDARHDDLLKRLEELDQRVASVLSQCQPAGREDLPDLDPSSEG